jgi:hypothetical protein
MQAGTLPGGLEHGFGLRVVHPLADQDGAMAEAMRATEAMS